MVGSSSHSLEYSITRHRDKVALDEWMENPDLFLRKDYETKKAMIQDMMVPMTAEMVVQEINRYADSEFRYSGTSDEVAISGQVREMRLLEEARRRYMEEKNAS